MELSAPAPGDGVLTCTFISFQINLGTFSTQYLRTSSPSAYRNNPSGEPGACIPSFSAKIILHAPGCSHPHQTTEPRLIYAHTTKGARCRIKAGHPTNSACSLSSVLLPSNSDTATQKAQAFPLKRYPPLPP
ncbi:unnamed protein product [Ectocarpus sp. 12 AP-2014]